MFWITVSFPLMIIYNLRAVAVLTGASQVYTCTFGDTARLFSPRSDREHLKEFRQYRVWKGNISFAVIEKGSQTEPTDIPSHGNATTDGNKTRGISSGVSLTLSVLLVVRLLSISLFLLWASN
ncbi:uncharacterized protein LOC110044775 isoform X3 [Orbicella faveolata]|uniref:uncharacterized protein LOC110044775 isoform X3 n=1 Tax=Orbicella faveolata TaxID=48498 RepID=UPI0009E22158|nr:uncharacterized protein LOC110044775 isoform X3 [Orbicella faveolata]